jgi:G:T-mismatch repair DNA endonuclease (very short patch repair protein)
MKMHAEGLLQRLQERTRMSGCNSLVLNATHFLVLFHWAVWHLKPLLQ